MKFSLTKEEGSLELTACRQPFDGYLTSMEQNSNSSFLAWPRTPAGEGGCREVFHSSGSLHCTFWAYEGQPAGRTLPAQFLPDLSVSCGCHTIWCWWETNNSSNQLSHFGSSMVENSQGCAHPRGATAFKLRIILLSARTCGTEGRRLS